MTMVVVAMVPYQHSCQPAIRTSAVSGGAVLTEGAHLKELLGMVLAPNGNIITTIAGLEPGHSR